MKFFNSIVYRLIYYYHIRAYSSTLYQFHKSNSRNRLLYLDKRVNDRNHIIERSSECKSGSCHAYIEVI